MLLGTLAGLMWPAITRMPFVAPHPARMFGLLVALVVALPAHDYLLRRRLHPVSTWGAIMILMSFPLRVAVGNSATWHHLASWITS
jgi:multisubunit Na+/H+ antiporter MnhE subunit